MTTAVRDCEVLSTTVFPTISFDINCCSFGGVTCSNGRISSLFLQLGISAPLNESIGNLDGLTSLYLSNNNFNGPIPASLGNLTNLKSLYLPNNNFSSTIPDSISKIASLQRLDLSGNNLVGSVPASLGNLPDLQFLNFSKNPHLSGALPTFSKIPDNCDGHDTDICGASLDTATSCNLSCYSSAQKSPSHTTLIVVLVVGFLVCAIGIYFGRKYASSMIGRIFKQGKPKSDQAENLMETAVPEPMIMSNQASASAQAPLPSIALFKTPTQTYTSVEASSPAYPHAFAPLTVSVPDPVHTIAGNASPAALFIPPRGHTIESMQRPVDMHRSPAYIASPQLQQSDQINLNSAQAYPQSHQPTEMHLYPNLAAHFQLQSPNAVHQAPEQVSNLYYQAPMKTTSFIPGNAAFSPFSAPAVSELGVTQYFADTYADYPTLPRVPEKTESMLKDHVAPTTRGNDLPHIPQITTLIESEANIPSTFVDTETACPIVEQADSKQVASAPVVSVETRLSATPEIETTDKSTHSILVAEPQPIVASLVKNDTDLK
ncbi:hypothetical protein BDV3_006844 [Batrachochytrium dendrobatidis]